MVQGDVFLKRGRGRGVALFLSNFFKVFTFLSFLHLEITLPFEKLCYAFEEKNFSATIILWKKLILSYLKMNLKISHKLW